MNMKSNIVLILIFSLLGLSSCSRNNLLTTEKTGLIVNISERVSSGDLSGSKLASSGLQKTNTNQKFEVDFDSNYSLEGILSESGSTTNKKIAATGPVEVTQALPNDTWYRVVAFNSSGIAGSAYYQVGQSVNHGIPLSDGAYDVLIYSLGTTSKADLEAVLLDGTTLSTASFKDLDASKHFMFTTSNATLTNSESKTIDVQLRHRFSLIRANITSLASVGNIKNANITVSNQSGTADIKVNDGVITTKSTDNRTHSLALGSNPLEANGNIILSGNTSTVSLTVTIEVDGKAPVTNTFSNISITPGHRYDLNILIKETTGGGCYLEMEPTSLQTTTAWSLGTNSPTGSVYANAGFQIDILEIDNSLSLMVNGEPIYEGSYTYPNTPSLTRTTNEINFQGWDAIRQHNDVVVNYANGIETYFPANVYFSDGDRWAIQSGSISTQNPNGISSNVNWSYSSVHPIWAYNGVSPSTPMLRLIVDENGNVKLYGSKVPNGPLSEVIPVTNFNTSTLFVPYNSPLDRNINVNGAFKKVTWNKNAINIVNFTMENFGATRISGTGFGRVKADCSEPGAKPL